MKNRTMMVSFEMWTPARAKEVLSGQEDVGGAVLQRRKRKGMISKYARDMKSGAWVTTHQAVALGPNGELIDGQHRLSAIVESGISQEMLTARYLTIEAATAALSATDIGGKRTVAEVLSISGVVDKERARLTVAVTIAVRVLLDPLSRPDATPQEVHAIFEMQRAHIEWAVTTFPRKGFAAPVMAAFAFARSFFQEKVEEFAATVVGGVAIPGTASHTWNRLSLAHALSTHGGSAERFEVMRRALRVIRAAITDEGDLPRVYDSPRETVEWFRAKRRRPMLAQAAE